jgi:hypothetical protein
MHNHEAHLEECASRFVLQAFRPECVPAMTSVLQEHILSRSLCAHIHLQEHFFWYCEHIWRFCEQAGLAARVQVLTARLHHWHELLAAFDNTTSTVDVNTILLALVPNP